MVNNAPFLPSFQDEEGDVRATIESLSPRDGVTGSKDVATGNKDGANSDAIVALAAKCSESILNPDYLLGKFLFFR